MYKITSAWLTVNVNTLTINKEYFNTHTSTDNFDLILLSKNIDLHSKPIISSSNLSVRNIRKHLQLIKSKQKILKVMKAVDADAETSRLSIVNDKMIMPVAVDQARKS